MYLKLQAKSAAKPPQARQVTNRIRQREKRIVMYIEFPQMIKELSKNGG